MHKPSDFEMNRRWKASPDILSAFGSHRLQPVVWGRTDCGPLWSRHDALHKASSEKIHVVLFPIAGSAWFEAEGVRVELRPGGIYWTPATDVTLPFSRGCSEFFSHFYLAFYYEIIGGINLLDYWQTPAQIGEWDVERNVDAWHPEAISTHNAWLITATVEAALIRFCELRLGEAIKTQRLIQSRLAEVFAYIEAHLSATLRIEDLRRVACLSRSAFTRNFIRITGLSPKDYLNLLLARKAAGILIQSSLSVKEIAETLEFTNENYFNRFFSKQIGISPGRYRAHAERTWQ